MTWVKIDDNFHSHPKAIRAGLHGRALFVAALCWTKRHLTDGCIPSSALPLICHEAGVKPQVVDVLVDVGLFDPDPVDGWRVHDFADHNESAETVRSRRRRAAERTARWRAQRTGDADGDASRDAHGDASPSRRGNAHVTLPETETETETNKKSSNRSGIRARGPEEEPPTPDDRTSQIIERVIDWRIDHANGHIRDPAAFRAAERRKILNSDEGTWIHTLAVKWPTTPIDTLAARILGQHTNPSSWT